jgi:hypothetical protein
MRFTRYLAGLALAGAAVAGLAAPASAAPYMTAGQVAAHLARLGCHATAPAPGASVDIGIKPKVELECTIADEDVTIDEYRTSQQLAYMVKFAQGYGCQLAKAFGETGPFYSVRGSNWDVSAKTLPTTYRVKAAIGNGARVSVIPC